MLMGLGCGSDGIRWSLGGVVTFGIANEQALQAATVAPAEMSGWKEPRARPTVAMLASCNSARMWIFANGMALPCSCPAGT